MKFQERCNCQTNHHIYDHPGTPFVVWPYNEKRRHECCKASNNNEGVRDENSRKAQNEVDGQSAERFETTPARVQSSHRTEKHVERQSWRLTGIISAKVSTVPAHETFLGNAQISSASRLRAAHDLRMHSVSHPVYAMM